MNIIKNWNDMPRVDLNVIPFLQSKGFEPVFDYKDRRHQRITPENCPHDTVHFKNSIGNVIKLGYKYVPTEEKYGVSVINTMVNYWILISDSGTKEADKIEDLFNL